MAHLELRNLRKRFGSTIALDGATFEVVPGEIHALLGENGAGKTTLVRALVGLVRPDGGEIRVDGRRTEVRDPSHSLELGIGLVHQHSMLVPALTVAENLVLGEAGAPWLSPSRVSERARDVLGAHDLALEPDALVRELPVAQQQRLEIVRALSRGVRVLILDEPTAVLAPSEVEELLSLLARLRDEGRSVVFISHKLEEVTAVCDRVSVLRHGRTVATEPVVDLDPRELGRMMVGEEISPPGEPPDAPGGAIALRITGLRAGRIHDLDLGVREGEIYAITGLDGNGQASLEEVSAGLLGPEAGTFEVVQPPLRIITGDRQRQGLVLGLSAEENLILVDTVHEEGEPLFRFGLLRRSRLTEFARETMNRFEIRGRTDRLVATLSGGNQQRLLVARSLVRRPGVLVAVNPTRGVDVRSTRFIRNELRRVALLGTAVLLITTDLEKTLELGNRIGVLFRGTLRAVEPGQRTRARIGELMLGRSA